ncbi:DNA-methyltransferase [Microbacterium aurantiacum]|uniref:DNA-methyltransferase n=1 Tax=Microbacterium aurantiacum TaxID=162393 RepID=UPI003424932E
MTLYYEDEYVQLHHGDCRGIRGWTRADVLVTDPPYGVAWLSGQFSNAKVPIETDVAGDADTGARDAVLEMWGKNRPALVFGSWRAPRPQDVNNRLIWYKAANIPGHRTQPWFAADEEIYQLGTGFIGKPEQNVLVTHDRRDGAHGEVAKLGHPTPKPVGLMERLIAKCPPGVIADPFAGSGATLLAARNLGRKAIGVELEEKYCELIVKRLSQQAFDFSALEGVS